MITRRELVDRLLEAPTALALLADLAGLLPDELGLDDAVPADAQERVAAAVDAVAAMSFGALMARAVDVGAMRVGPWISDGPLAAWRAYRARDHLGPLAEAVVDAHFGGLVAPVDLDRQEWWTCYPDDAYEPHRLFVDYGDVYDGGELTWAALRTVTAPPAEAHHALATAWELDWPPVSRWRVPVVGSPRVHEIVTPDDWAWLVHTYPAGDLADRPERRHTSWSIIQPPQPPARVTPGWSAVPERPNTVVLTLAEVPGQHAVALEPAAHHQPDWAAIAADIDGVHLTWAGFLTTEGYVRTHDDGAVDLLRYWFSERTLWLRDVVGEPEPLPSPAFEDVGDEPYGVDVRVDRERQARDRRTLAQLLGRG